MTLIEKIAKELYERRFRGDSFTQQVLFGGPLTFEELMARTENGSIIPSVLSDFMADARAALAPIRDELKSIWAAAEKTYPNCYDGSDFETFKVETFDVIDAALGEEATGGKT